LHITLTSRGAAIEWSQANGTGGAGGGGSSGRTHSGWIVVTRGRPVNWSRSFGTGGATVGSTVRPHSGWTVVTRRRPITWSGAFGAGGAAIGGAGSEDEAKRKRRRIVKVGGELVITTSDAVVAAALNDAETTESIPIKAIKAQAKAFKHTADMSAMLKAQQYEKAIELYKALVAQDEEDIELLLMNL